MKRLSERAASLRIVMATEEEKAELADLEQRAALHAATLDRTVKTVAKVRQAIEAIARTNGAVTRDVAAAPRALARIITEARKKATKDPKAYLRSGTRGDVDLALERFENDASAAVLEAWRTHAEAEAHAAGIELADVLATALRPLPQFRRRVDEMESAAREVSLALRRSDLPSDETIGKFATAVSTLATRVQELTQEVPAELRDVILRAGEPHGLSLCEVPNNLVEWIREKRACDEFRVVLSRRLQ